MVGALLAGGVLLGGLALGWLLTQRPRRGRTSDFRLPGGTAGGGGVALASEAPVDELGVLVDVDRRRGPLG